MDLAQTNLAWARFPLDDPRMAEFVEAIDRMSTGRARYGIVSP